MEKAVWVRFVFVVEGFPDVIVYVIKETDRMFITNQEVVEEETEKDGEWGVDRKIVKRMKFYNKDHVFSVEIVDDIAPAEGFIPYLD